MGRQTCFFPQAPSNLVTLLYITIVLSKWRNLFAKYLPISGKLSITNFKTKCCWLSKSSDHRKQLEGRKKRYISKIGTTFTPHQKNAWGMRRDERTKKLESNNYAGTLSWKVFIASQRHWKWSDNIWKREVCSESMTKFSYIQFFVRNATISR